MFKKIQDRISDLVSSTVALTSGAATGLLLHKHLKRLDQNQIRKLVEQWGPGALEYFKRLMKGGSSGSAADCKDCDKYAYGFMLKDDVWLEALTQEERDEYPETTTTVTVIDPDKPPLYLCLHCIEKRLDRKVTVDDFNEDAQLNRPVLFAYESSRCPVSGPSRD